MPSKLKSEQIDLIADLAKNGESINRISKVTGFCRATIRRYLIRNKIYTGFYNGLYWKEKKEQRAFELYQDGKNVWEIASILDLKPLTIFNYINERFLEK